MARAYSDDLRRKILEAYGRGSGSLAGLAERFGVSHGYTTKVRKQQLRSGQIGRALQRYGRRGRCRPRRRLIVWLSFRLAIPGRVVFQQSPEGVKKLGHFCWNWFWTVSAEA
jgi:hypothetical protein